MTNDQVQPLQIITVVQFSYKVVSTCELLVKNLHTPHKYTQGYSPVEDLRGLKLVQDFN